LCPFELWSIKNLVYRDVSSFTVCIIFVSHYYHYYLLMFLVSCHERFMLDKEENEENGVGDGKDDARDHVDCFRHSYGIFDDPPSQCWNG